MVLSFILSGWSVRKGWSVEKGERGEQGEREGGEGKGEGIMEMRSGIV